MTPAEIEASLDPEVLAQLRAVAIVPGRPLLAIDADEVLVYLAEHLARYLPTIGFRIRLTQYQLEGSIFPAGCEIPVPFDDCLRLIDRFFDDENSARHRVWTSRSNDCLANCRESGCVSPRSDAKSVNTFFPNPAQGA